MTAAGMSKAEARRRAVEANRRANKERAERDKANIKDATILLVALGEIAEVDAWKKKRFAELRAQAEKEATKRVSDKRAAAGAAIGRMRDRGETLTMIATKHDVGIGIVRTMLRHHAPTTGNTAATDGSHALGGGEQGSADLGGVDVGGDQSLPNAAAD